MKKIIHTIEAVCLLLLGIYLIGSGGVGLYAAEEEVVTIYDGIYLGNVDVGGMTEQEAENAYNQYLRDLRPSFKKRANSSEMRA